MAFYDKLFSNRIDEAIKAFDNKGERVLTDKQILDQAGEGIEDIYLSGQGYGKVGIQGFNSFYNRYINKVYESEVSKIFNYRTMAENAEIGDVIEDACNEAISEYDEGGFLQLEFKDEKLEKNENIVNNIYNEFVELFENRINCGEKLWDMFRSYLVDGRVFYERIIKQSNQKDGIITIKKLPAETMDFVYNPRTTKIEQYYQYLSKNVKRPATPEEAEKREDVVVFLPEQIGFLDYGLYGKTRQEIFGFLEKAKVAYNQLKLLETSVIIYRIVRAPERLVFKIDTGNMPKDKALKFVEKIKTRFIKKQSYNPTTGEMSQEPEVMCIRRNTEIPLLDGRYLTLEQLVKEHSTGKENWVYTINQDTLNVEPGKIKHAAITRLNEPLIRMHLDDGSYFDSTHDHKYVLRDGSECRADMLQKGVALMPMNTRMGHIGTHKVEYEQIYCPSDEKWRFTHRIVANHVNGKYKGIVHHKNFDRFNNSPENLQIMSNEEHHHMHGENIRNMFKNPEYRKKHSEWVIRTNIEQNKVEKMRKVLNTPAARAMQKAAVKKSKTEWFAVPENKEQFRKKKTIMFDETALKMLCDIFIESGCVSRDKLLNLLSNNKEFMTYLEGLNNEQFIVNKQFNHLNKGILWNMIHEMGYNDYVDFRSNYQGYMNHKVARIEYLSERDDCGCLEIEGNHNFAISQKGTSKIVSKNSILENFYLPVSSDGRGSDITSIGGDAKGFTELDDIYYFSRKLYRALKYPLSRVTAAQEKGESMFGTSSANEISRDEIKWAKFLERQQTKFCNELRDLFLLHLEFRGLKKQYNLSKDSFQITMPVPSHYKDSMAQAFREQQFSNYNQLSNNPEFSKTFLIKRYLDWTDEDLKENKKGFKLDKKYFPAPEEGMDTEEGMGMDTGTEELPSELL